jgi:hypothetical protein
MRRAVLLVSVVLVLAAIGAAAAWQEREAAGGAAPVSWDNFRLAQQNAKTSSDAAKYKEACEAYLEYIRQAEGLGRPELVAWGRNNAAFALIRMHKQDSSVDLAPAKKLLTEGLAMAEATPECKQAIETNLAYVDRFIKK